jgi:hypothetical protein
LWYTFWTWLWKTRRVSNKKYELLTFIVTWVHPLQSPCYSSFLVFCVVFVFVLRLVSPVVDSWLNPSVFYNIELLSSHTPRKWFKSFIPNSSSIVESHTSVYHSPAYWYSVRFHVMNVDSENKYLLCGQFSC